MKSKTVKKSVKKSVKTVKKSKPTKMGKLTPYYLKWYKVGYATFFILWCYELGIQCDAKGLQKHDFETWLGRKRVEFFNLTGMKVENAGYQDKFRQWMMKGVLK